MAMMHAGSYDDEECHNIDTEKFNASKLKVECPKCQRVFAALKSPHTKSGEGYWRWVGCDYKEPACDHTTKCVKCGTEFAFTTFTGQ